MSNHKKYRCVCKVCHQPFRSKEKFKDLCGVHNKRDGSDKQEREERGNLRDQNMSGLSERV